MNLNQIPIIGWIISFVFMTSLSLPFWIFWTLLKIGKDYFYWLPEVYHNIPFWDCVGLFTCVGIMKSVIFFRFFINFKSGKEATG